MIVHRPVVRPDDARRLSFELEKADISSSRRESTTSPAHGDRWYAGSAASVDIG